MKCIFLDFDGVVNNWNDHFDIGVSLENARVLKEIVSKTDAKIVVTSSVKYFVQQINKECSLKDVLSSKIMKIYVDELSKLGIEIYDVTPYINEGDRNLEIKEYLNKHDISEYVIIDDELVCKDLQEHQVFLDLYKGLLQEHIEPILNILDGKLGFYPKEYDRNETFEELLKRINIYYSNQDKKIK